MEKLHISSHWLATGEGGIFQSEVEREFYRRLNSLKAATSGANIEGLTDSQQFTLQQILFAYESGMTEPLKTLLAGVLAHDEKLLLERYRAAPQTLRTVVLKMLE